MKRQLVLLAAVLIVGAILGATVLRTDVAEATSLAQSVFVNNTTADPVPVVEQNLDKNNGAIRVHEQGVVPTRQAGQPFSITLEGDGHGFTVPDGEQVNIRYVNGVTNSVCLDIPEQISVGGTVYYFPVRPAGPGISANILSESVNINAPAGASIVNHGYCTLSLSGWLVP